MERNIDFLQKELTTKNEFTKTLMGTQSDLVNIQEKASFQNLNKKINHRWFQQNQQPSPQNQKSQQKHFSCSHNQNNQQHRTENRTDQLQLPDQNFKKSHQPKPQHQTQPQQTSLYIGNLDQKTNEEDLYKLFDLKSPKYKLKLLY